MRKAMFCLAVALLTSSICLASPMNGSYTGIVPAGPVNSGKTGDNWNKFYFGGTGSFATGGASGGEPNTFPSLSSPPWTFFGPADIRVTDAFLAGDQFAVYDFGVLIGTTSGGVSTGGTDIDPVLAFANPIYGKGVFSVGGGNHSITIQAVTSPFGGGGAFFQVVATPEPLSVVVFGGL
ncbi:MAG: hypothetical protein ABGY75_11510, partial [Gemmataceae bacterium]